MTVVPTTIMSMPMTTVMMATAAMMMTAATVMMTATSVMTDRHLRDDDRHLRDDRRRRDDDRHLRDDHRHGGQRFRMAASTRPQFLMQERPDEAFSLSSLFPDSRECHPVEPNPLKVTLRHKHKRMTLASLGSMFRWLFDQQVGRRYAGAFLG